MTDAIQDNDEVNAARAGDKSPARGRPIIDGSNAMKSDVVELHTAELDAAELDGAEPDGTAVESENIFDQSIFEQSSFTTLDDVAPNRDGRTLRRTRNRDAVVGALLELMRAGHIEPTVAEIAECAGVSHRSVFRYFDDLDDLVRAAIDREVRDALPLVVLADIGVGALEQRVESFVDSRLKLYERTYRVGRVARHRSTTIPTIDDGFRSIYQLLRLQVRNHFGTELNGLEPDDADLVVDTMLLLISFESYDTQLRLFEYDRERIRLVWTHGLATLLGG